MVKYFTKPRMIADDDIWPDEGMLPLSGMTVHVAHPEYRDTGLLDECGETIYACEKIKCGFIK